MSPCSIAAILRQAKQHLAHSETALLDAEILLAAILQVPRSYVYAHPEQALDDSQIQHFFELVQRRKQGEPVAYLLGVQEFWSLPLKVTKDTLIPRPDTEVLVAAALQLLPENERLRLADLGTGSGAIALALAFVRPHWQITATDISLAALITAQQNAMHLQLSNIEFLESDWFVGLKGRKFSAIISNPPYIDPAIKESLTPELSFEPNQALFAEQQGLADLRKIIQQAKAYLQADGWLLLEHGYDQADQVAEYLQQQGYQQISLYRDLANLPRVTIARWKVY